MLTITIHHNGDLSISMHALWERSKNASRNKLTGTGFWKHFNVLQCLYHDHLFRHLLEFSINEYMSIDITEQEMSRPSVLCILLPPKNLATTGTPDSRSMCLHMLSVTNIRMDASVYVAFMGKRYMLTLCCELDSPTVIALFSLDLLFCWYSVGSLVHGDSSLFAAIVHMFPFTVLFFNEFSIFDSRSQALFSRQYSCPIVFLGV